MEALKNILDQIKEKLKSSWAEQQESASYIALKDRFDNLPPLGQKGVLIGFGVLIVTLVLYWPVSSFLDSVSRYSEFDDKRAAVKELKKLVKEDRKSVV